MHTDIKRDNFILQRMPEQWRPYALLMRLDRPIGVWLLFWPGAWAIAASHGRLDGYAFFLICVFGFGALVMRAAGCVFNDILDRDLDKQVERTKTRPLASGVVNIWQAGALLCVLLFLALIALLQMNGLVMQLGFLSLVLVAAYPLMKRFTWWPQAFLGITFNWGALMGTAAIDEHITLVGIIIYVAGILWTLGYDTIYAAQDKEDDALVGIKSTALLFGERAPYWVAGFYMGALFLLYLAGFVAEFSGAVPPFFHLCLGFAGLHLVWQIYKWDLANPLSSLKVFRSNKYTGALIFLAFLFI